MSLRYISNDIPLQPLSTAPEDLLVATLDQLIRDVPPPISVSATGHKSHRRSGGLFTGYTGLAYLFLHVSARQPQLLIAKHKGIEWARRYLGEEEEDHDTHTELEAGCCGIGSERLSHDAVKACIIKDAKDVARFLKQVNRIVQVRRISRKDGHSGEDPFPSELVKGRAGTLYLLRMVKHWVPNAGEQIDTLMQAIAEDILDTDDEGQGNWEWHGKRYFGAAHGDIGIITQVVLSVPSIASRLSGKLQELLDYQLEDGNFPSSSRSLQKGKADLVQWCHGAPGFIYSLQAIRPYFPELQDRIDDAVNKAQKLVWSKGLLVKQPCLCHGIFGNAL